MQSESNQKLNLHQIFLQIYQQPVTNTRPEKELVSLRKILNCTAKPGTRLTEVFELIHEAELKGDQKEKARLKQKFLIYFTPCVIVNPRRDYASIKAFTGLLVLDFDHISNASDFKNFLFETYRCIVAAWLSPSSRGVKALVKIPLVNSVSEFKQYFRGIASEMEQYAGFDPTGQNPILPLFQSGDPDLLERDDPETWQVKAILPPTVPSSPPIDRFAPALDSQRKRAQEIILRGFSTRLRNIVDIGHPIVRSVAYTAGGYVASGQLAEMDLFRFMDAWIDGHPYLRQKSQTYKRTVRDMIARGKMAPLTLDSSQLRPTPHQLDDFLTCNS